MRFAAAIAAAVGVVVLEGASASSGQERTALFSSLDASSLIGKPVTDSKWDQVARVDSVLIDPESGRITYLILTFVNRQERIALPWRALLFDTRGRARLASKTALRENAISLGAVAAAPPAPLPELKGLEGEPADFVGFQAEEADGGAVLRGRVVGNVILKDEAGFRNVRLMVATGAESIRVDLGREESLKELGFRVSVGDEIQLEATKAEGGALRASVVRVGGATFQLGSR